MEWINKAAFRCGLGLRKCRSICEGFNRGTKRPEYRTQTRAAPTGRLGKRSARPGAGRIARGLQAGFWLSALLGMGEAKAPAVDRVAGAAPVQVNRTLPQVEPPAATLAFLERPTPQEIFRARLFEEPLIPVGADPGASENAALAAALLGYSKRTSPDDFSSLTGFLQKHPHSPWRAALLTNIGLEYYSTAHYSLALDAWTKAWSLAKDATDPHGKAIADRAVGELAYMYARLGRMTELDALLKSVGDRTVCGPATEKISGAKAGLSNMKDRPEIAFRCGPLALHRIKLAVDPKNPGDTEIYKSASTQKGFSLAQVAALSQKVDLRYQMAFREKGAPFILPAVVHWKVGHYAAVIRQQGDRFLLQDPTFWNDVWATSEALDSECSGYFLVPPGELPKGWRKVATKEAENVWGKGNVCCKDPDPHGCKDPKKDDSCNKQPCKGMAVASAHLMLVSLNIVDEPVGYSPPVGPAVRSVITYNQREANQPTIFTYSNFGPKWTFDWLSYIKDNPLSPSADVKYYMMGGGTRTFTGFDTNTQTFAFEQYDQNRLTRTGPSSYEMLSPDGSRRIFGQSDGSAGSSRKVFLTQWMDPHGNAVSLTYDAELRVVAIADAIGQVSTISYADPTDIYKITKITDPFGRAATFDYDPYGRLNKITDVIGLTSQFAYEGDSDFINALITPYGTNTFIRGESGTTAWLETLYPDGERDRVEFNQSTTLGIPASVPAASLPLGMATHNDYLYYRNTYYWSKIAYASTYPDYTKAKIYHWLHTADGASASGILESTKEPLEGRVWYDYAGQSDSIVVGVNNKPLHISRVLDDGTTQLYIYEYDGFGHVTKSIDPVGRTFTYIYSTNGIDLLEVRQTRAGNNELLSKTTYNAQHLPLTDADAAGQTTAYTYNALGQVLTETDARNGTTTYSYDTDGHLVSVNGPLPGTNYLVTLSYDSLGRVRTKRDINGHTLTFDYDALDRLTKITYPDSTFEQFGYTRLDLTTARDRVSRQTIYEFNEVRQMATLTDPLNRAQHLQWCKCGDTRSMTDPMGHTTTWHHDIQGRVISKEFADGSKINYTYENTTSRLRQRVDEKLQVTGYNYNRDDTLSDVSYANSVVTTPAVAYTYDPNYERVTSMTDGTGTTRYGYVPITGVASPGAGQLASVDGPLPNDTISFGYDDLGRRVSTSINGVTTSVSLDAIARVLVETNALGVFGYSYDGGSFRTTLETFPNGQTAERSYTVTAQDNQLKRITHKVGITPVSEFLYERDVAAGRITSWSQQAGTEPPSVYGLNYDAANQLTLATVTNAGLLVNTFAYAYDLAANRLTERVGSITNTASYNALNQLTAIPDISGAAVTNEWDAEQRLIAVTTGNQRTEFDYDGLGRRVGIRKLVSGSEVSNRRFVWCDDTICEERDFAGSVIKRFFDQGVKIESGPQVGNYYYTRDHLRSVRELTDTAGTIRARYAYDPFGRQTQIAGDVASDFGFAGMFAPAETGLNLTKFRAYDSALGRWLSRDPLKDAELLQGANIYAYVANNPVNLTDPLGLCCEQEQQRVANAAVALSKCLDENQKKKNAFNAKVGPCKEQFHENYAAGIDLYWCLKKPCTPPPTCKPPIPPKPPDPPKPPNPPKCRFYFGPFCVY